jgi:hypothetical protein
LKHETAEATNATAKILVILLGFILVIYLA